MAIVTPQSTPTPEAPAADNRQPHTNEAPATPAATPEEQFSPKFAALAKKEKALRAKDLDIKAREEAFSKRELERESEYKSKFIHKDKVKENPLGVLQELGLTYDDLTQLILNPPKGSDPEIYELKQQLEELKKAQEQTKTSFEENQKKQYDQAVNNIRNEAKQLIDSNADYEMIKDTNNVEAVVELIKETFETEQRLLSVEDASKMVETYLVDEAIKMASLNKVKARLAPAPEQIPEATQTQKPQPQQLKTLTNAATATAPKRMSEKDRVERAKLAFMGQLK